MRRRVVPLLLSSLLVAGGVAAPGASAMLGTPCAGMVDLELSAVSLPGGERSLTDGCLRADAFFEVELAGHRLVLALTEVDWSDGSAGRLALATLSAPDGRAASLVGVEDAAAGSVRWVYGEGAHRSGDGSTSITSEGVTDLADDPASSEIRIEGRGADLLTAPGPAVEAVRGLVQEAVAALR